MIVKDVELYSVMAESKKILGNLIKKMKIALIDPVGGHGGMEYYDYGLAYGLSNSNCNVFYYTCHNTQERFYENVSIDKCFGDVWKANKMVRLKYFLIGYLKSFKRAKMNDCKIFHFQFFDLGILNLSVLMLALFYKQKKVVTLHDIESFSKSANKFVHKLCLYLIDGIIVHNEFSKNQFLEKNKFEKRLAVIPHGNYLPFIKSLPLSLDSNKIRLLFFGQIKDVKGLDVLLEAMSIVKNSSSNYSLTIAGRPWKTEKESYLKTISRLNLQNDIKTYFEYIKEEDVSSYYEKSDVIILPYKKIYQSGVLLLSLSYGRTVIVSDLEPFKEVISHESNGLIFESENPADLARKILQLDKSLINSMTNNSKNSISNDYDWLKIGIKTNLFYNTL